MSEIITIQGINCYEENGIAYLKLETVARGLGFTQIAKSGNEVVRWERVVGYLKELGVIPTSGDASQQVGKDGLPDYIPENIFYRLAMKAKNETAEKFQALIADEVIPQIRKTGVYVSSKMDSDMLFKIAQAMQEKEQKISALEEQKALMQPKADFYDTVTGSNDVIDIGDCARVLNVPGYGRNKLFRFLREQHILMVDNRPYQEYIDRGYFRCIEGVYEKPDGTTLMYVKTVVYQKGLDYIRKRLQEKMAG